MFGRESLVTLARDLTALPSVRAHHVAFAEQVRLPGHGVVAVHVLRRLGQVKDDRAEARSQFLRSSNR